MSKTEVLDPSMVSVEVYEAPVKNANNQVTLNKDDLQTQANYLRESMVPVDYETVRGTCGDERFRVGLLSGDSIVEARPSVFGGPDIYGLYISEGAGVFKGSALNATERLGQTKRLLNRNGVKSGGHEHCAAAAGFESVVGNIIENAEAVKAYAKLNMEDFDEELMDEVLANFSKASEDKTYEGWNGEAALKEVLGEEAGEAIEKLADVPHEGRTLARNKRKGYTIDQTLVHQNADGEDSFEWDDPYADRIENALAAGPEASKIKRLMEHAREAVLVGVALAVPNREIHQIDTK